MTVITFGGCHGVGKTTIANQLIVDAPLCKITDSDMIPIKGTGFKQQIMRSSLAFQVMDAIPSHINTIIDRSPLDFKIYNNVVMREGTDEWEICNEVSDKLIKRYKQIGSTVNLLIYDEYDSIVKKIQKRGRIGMSESDEIFTRKVYDLFYEDKGLNYEKLCGVKSVFIHVDDVPQYLVKLLSI